MKSATLFEIAQQAGVSQMTVSRALRGIGQVKPETRKRIQEIAEKLGYSDSGRVVFSPAVRRGKSGHFLRILLPVFRQESMQSEFGVRVLEGMKERMASFSGEIRLVDCNDLDDVLAAWGKERFHGIVLRQQLPLSWIERLSELGPVIYATAHDYQYGVDCVYTNEYRSAAKILDCLTHNGHRNIVWLGLLDRNNPEELPHKWFDESTTVDRRTSAIHGVRYAAWSSLAVCQLGENTQSLVLKEQDCAKETFSETVEKALDKALSVTLRPTAIVTPSDGVGLEILRVLKARGIKVPQEMSVISYGATQEGRSHSPALTSISFPVEAIGRTVLELVERRLANPNGPPVSMQFETQLFPGETVGPCS